MIEIRDAYCSYDGKEAVLRGVDLTIGKGTFTAVVGRNASGKTTLAKLINGLVLPFRGKVLVDGLDTSDPSSLMKIRRKVGFIFSNPSSNILGSTVLEDIRFGLENIHEDGAFIAAAAARAVSSFSLDRLGNTHPAFLSPGQKQTVALAGILAMSPGCIIIDEGTSFLDCAERSRFLMSLAALKEKGISVIYITHSLHDYGCFDNCVCLDGGKIAYSGPVSGLLALEGIGDIIELPPALALAAALKESKVPEGVNQMIRALGGPEPGGRV